MEEIRLNKYLSESGVCSRREADRLIEQGKVLVDGKPAVMGMKIRPDQEIQDLIDSVSQTAQTEAADEAA